MTSTSLTKATHLGLLSLLAWSVACGGPASSPVPPPPVVVWTGVKPLDLGAAMSRDLEATFLTIAPVGTGWNALSSESRSGCVDGTRQTTPSTETTLRRFAQPFSADEAAALGSSAMTSARFESSQGVQPPEWQDPLALRLIYGVEWRLAQEQLAPGSASLVVPPADPYFRAFCGDAYYGQVDLGGRLLVELTLRFSTRAAHDAFVRLLGTAPAIWDLGPVTSAHPELFAGQLSTSRSIRMVGGDGAGVVAGLNPDALLACGGGPVASCNDLLQQLVAMTIATGPGSAAESVAARPAQLGIHLASYAGLGGPVARVRPVEVASALTALDAAYAGQARLGHRLQTLSQYWPASQVTYPGGLGAASVSVDRNRALLRSVAQTCFSIGGPDDAAGIASCVDASSPASLVTLGYDSRLILDAFPLP